MKGTLIGYACIILVLLAWATLPSPVELYSQRILGQPVITVTIPNYTHRMILWAEWIRLPHRRRRHYPRRHRLPRKRRRRLQLRLRRILKRKTHGPRTARRGGEERVFENREKNPHSRRCDDCGDSRPLLGSIGLAQHCLAFHLSELCLGNTMLPGGSDLPRVGKWAESGHMHR